jgi:very-short-patch-repair endonuclease
VAPRDDLETQLREALLSEGLAVVPHFGASRYRIGLAVRHPAEADRYLVAIESDGPGYHSAPTARDRDRLREEHLEIRGWRFLRMWSPDWFRSRDREVARVMGAYREALAGEHSQGALAGTSGGPTAAAAVAAAPEQLRGTPPALARGLPIDDYDEAGLRRLLRWIKSDGRLRTDDDLLEAMMGELGLERHGRRIDARLRGVIEAGRRPPD